MNLLLCALGAYFVVQGVKLASLPKIWASSTKMVMAMLVSFGVAAALFEPHHPIYMGIYGVAGAGLAALIHKIARWFSVSADSTIKDLMRKR